MSFMCLQDVLQNPVLCVAIRTIFDLQNSIPTGTIRFETLANHPAAVALSLERCLEIAIEYLIGWDTVSKHEKCGGYSRRTLAQRSRRQNFGSILT